MKVRALIGFASLEATLSTGKEADLSEKVAKDLLKCGYVEEIESTVSKKAKPSSKKVVVADEVK